MIHLRGRLTRRWDAEPFVALLTEDPDLPAVLRKQRALIADSAEARVGEFLATFCRGPVDQPEGVEQVLALPEDLFHLGSGDIVRVSPRGGELSVLYRRSASSNTIFTTERCNSMCLMCSQPPRDIDDSYLVELWLEAIPLMDRGTPELGITGGEPTLLGGGLIRLIRQCKHYLPDTALHLLTNGRLFCYLSRAQELASLDHSDLVLGIPLYGDTPQQHDFVVNAQGAFEQTVRGILNLERCGQRVEVRVVLHQHTVGRLPQLARFIARTLPFVEHVALMGLEPIGFVKMNLDALWIDPLDYGTELKEAVDTLRWAGIRTSLYNHQLCTVPPALWQVARRSISDWKNEYHEECEQCAARLLCGGFFTWASLRRSRGIHALTAEEVHCHAQALA